MKYILSFIISMFVIGNVCTQVKKVTIDIYGDFEIVLEVPNGFVTVNHLGKIIDIAIDGRTDYFIVGSSQGKIESVGNIDFDYYISGSREGKVQQIGNISFDYYIAGAREGKLESAGSTDFDYYIAGVREGKLEAVDQIKMDYYIAGSREGKVESIGSNRFDYYIIGSREGKFQSGNRSLEYNGIRFRLRGGF